MPLLARSTKEADPRFLFKLINEGGGGAMPPLLLVLVTVP
jgi:hypothetical protein